jgi:hypothetical protein
MSRLTVFLFGLAMLSSCKAYRIFPEEYRTFSATQARKTAFVLNPGLSEEYAILRESALFDLVQDSLAPHAVAIRLLPMERELAPANGIFNTILSLGQIPVLY